MRASFLFLGFCLLAAMGAAWAQTASPAMPVDPNQALPAQPVAPATPSAPEADGTGPSLTVLADSSLRGVLQELAQTWANNRDDGTQVPLTLTNAGTMRTELESDPTWDVVISADLDDVNAMTRQGLIRADGQQSLARNSLVIYGRAALLKNDDLNWFDLIGTQWQKIALGNPEEVASGRVARRALQKHDLFDDDHKSLYVYAETEPRVLQVAERDQADAVFVYKTDLTGVSIPGFEVFPLSTTDAPPVFYTAAIGRLAKNPAAAGSFIDYCASEAARPIWAKYGFERS